MAEHDTIAAISTPPGEGALAVVRISGAGARGIAARVLRMAGELQAGRVRRASVVTESGELIDDGVVSFFHGPRSYTGEDVVEFSGHGGPVVSGAVLRRVLDAGARAAGPGEFTQRAFLNGKLDLTQAEAVMDLIRAQTPLAARAAALQLEGRIGTETSALADALLSVIAHLEAYIDFPDEDIAPEVGEKMLAELETIRARIGRLLDTADEGRILREGVRLVICGRPNAGKSSLLNRLAGFERAIVSPVAGTTRDTIEESINLRGVPFRVIDTAGLRVTADVIEQEGVTRARRALENADLVLRLVDATDDAAFGDAPERTDEILVVNKCDLAPDSTGIFLKISCQTGEGIDTLVDAMVARVMGQDTPIREAHAAINARHQACLERARRSLDAGLDALAADREPEFVVVDLRDALDALGEVVGKLDTEDLLDRIFGTFCLGK